MSEPQISATPPEGEGKVHVRIPGLGIVRFPASMTDGEIAARRDELILEGQNRGTVGRALGTATEMAGKAVLPVLGGIGGGIIGNLPGVVLGSMAGEGANQGLGVTDPSMQDVVTAGVVPGVAGLAGKGFGALARRFPGARPILHDMAAERLAVKPGMLAPSRSSEDLYAIVAQQNPPIPATQLRAAAEALAKTEAGLSAGMKNDEINRVAQGLVNMIDQHGGNVPFQTLRAELRRIGDRSKSFASGSTGGEQQGAYKHLFRTGYDDMEAAAASGNPAMAATQGLKEANAAFKVEKVVEDLSELFSIKGGGISPRPDGGAAVNFATIIKKIEKDPTIKKSLGDAPYKDMMNDLYRMWKKTPALGSTGVDVGSKSANISMGSLGGLGMMAGSYFYGPTGGTFGGGAGALAGAVGPKIIARLVSTKMGRSVLQGMLDGNRGILTPEAVAVLGTAVGMSEPGRATTGAAVDFTKGVMQ